MVKTVLSNTRSKNTKSLFDGSSFVRMLRFIFLLFLAFLLVYIYYLYLKGNLQKTVLNLWVNHQKTIIPLSIFIAYTGIVFQFGVWRGRRR
ncbi:hypothetical protein [Mesobacillus selenatarsenatis]|uniref:Uncharacterized protein n=1 Tax=Mesobacillus selenatarsenatis TaxID=388741 RepID=A0A846TEX8_9BACI|nr:hypothetical protein [Mesobacillus selenatarsenatis]NKE03977.1 hypothetical protein [Mesobacillus selenatarsenatis]